MPTGQQFTVRYLFALLALWALALAAMRQYFATINDYWTGPIWLMVASVAFCPAIGGTFLKMRFGFIAGGVLAALWCGLWGWAMMQRYRHGY